MKNIDKFIYKMNKVSILVDYLENAFGEANEYSLRLFSRKQPFFEDKTREEIENYIVDEVLPTINVRQVVNGKRLYMKFIESFIDSSLHQIYNASTIKENTVIYKIIEFFNPKHHDLLPEYLSHLLPRLYDMNNSFSDYSIDFLEENKIFLIRLYIEDLEIANMVFSQYINDWDEIKASKWEFLIREGDIFCKTCFSIKYDSYIVYIKYLFEKYYSV